MTCLWSSGSPVFALWTPSARMSGKPIMLFACEERVFLERALIVVVVVLPQHILPRVRVIAAISPVGIVQAIITSTLARLGLWTIISVPRLPVRKISRPSKKKLASCPSGLA